ncbi:MAG TPA: glycoside hydrolase family 15 protein [Candidatus Limnocylindrales bacterium]
MTDRPPPLDPPPPLDGSLAPGRPGIAPTWSSSAKDAVGTALRASRVWFTVGRGILNEVYWPRVDRPEIRDLGFIVADDAGFWSEVKRDAEHEIAFEASGVPAITVRHRHARYELVLRICSDDHSDVVRIEATLTDPRPPGDPDRVARPLRLYPLVAPHVGFSGLDNRAWVGTYKGRPVLFAEKRISTLAVAVDPKPRRLSVGYVGVSDGWQDFAADGRMTWTYGATETGNVAGMLEVEPDASGRVQLALSFGTRPEEAGLLASASLTHPFDDVWDAYVDTWHEFLAGVTPAPDQLDPELEAEYLVSAAVLRAHQDRGSPGATVASLSIPWGSARNDLGGYHLVWSRDLVESAGALVALGALGAARRTLGYLAATQEPDGHWLQNQWVDGVAYWSGVQLDEAAYPILLAGALRDAGAHHMHGRRGDEAAAFEHLLTDEALDRLVQTAAGFLARTGPLTQQDRWEEDAGLTPSTLAPVVAALVVAARFLPEPSAAYVLELADDWNAAIEEWTYARGSHVAQEHGVDGHYVRIASPDVLAGAPLSTPVPVRNRPAPFDSAPGDELIGTDFLALVRFGLRRTDDPRILASVAVADALLRTETPSGPVWHRYTGDGYGEHEDGAPFDGTGMGRGWPLLVGERGHYALECGEDATAYLRAMLRMGSMGGMLPEQVWDTDDLPERGLFRGRPSGSAMPLAWAHAEYIKLARSIALGHPIDRPAAAWERYHGRRPRRVRATWRFTAPRPTFPSGTTLRLEFLARARVHCSLDGWRTTLDVDARDTGLGVWVCDVPGSASLPVGGSVLFTCFWPDAAGGAGRWEGRDVRVTVGPAELDGSA